MRKLLLAFVAIAGLAGSTFAPNAFAATGADNAVPSAAEIQRIQERQSVLLDAHLAGMKAALNLNAEQAKNWPAFEAAIRDAAKARWDRWTQARDRMAQGERPSPIDRMTIIGRTHREKRGGAAKSHRGEQASLREPRRYPEARVRSVDARVQAESHTLDAICRRGESGWDANA
jgi:predicted lipoprotein with Yx(FWY)xxD motif